MAEIRVIEDFDAGEGFEELSGFSDGNRAFGFDVDGFAVAVGDGDANAGGADLNGVIAEDFSGFEDHFEFFAGVAILFEAANLGDGVEGDGVAKGLVIVVCGIEGCSGSFEQVCGSLQTGTAGCLVGADDDSADAGGVVQWFQCDDHLRR